MSTGPGMLTSQIHFDMFQRHKERSWKIERILSLFDMCQHCTEHKKRTMFSLIPSETFPNRKRGIALNLRCLIRSGKCQRCKGSTLRDLSMQPLSGTILGHTEYSSLKPSLSDMFH